MEYYFNNLDPTSFQRLINSILIARFGEDTRLTPLRGADGGRDAETAPGNPYFEYQIISTPTTQGLFTSPRKGRYLFQVKHHRTTDTRISDARKSVIADFQKELKTNVLNRSGSERVNYFFLITNVPGSKAALVDLDEVRTNLLKDQGMHADVWWQEQVIAYLDLLPSLWRSFPNLFPGGMVPLLSEIAENSPSELPRAVRIMFEQQYARDSKVKFRQINLEQKLSKLFVDLNVNIHHLTSEEQQSLLNPSLIEERMPLDEITDEDDSSELQKLFNNSASAIGLLLDEKLGITRKILLEGGPGQGKSTITQMAAQIYRQHLLGKTDLDPEGRWNPPTKIRLPLRIELKNFAEWLNEHPDTSVEEFLVHKIKRSSGGSTVTTDSIHNLVENSPVLLIFDGLDEVGSEELRDKTLEEINACVHRFEAGLGADLRVVVTTRPPAIAGRRELLVDFMRFSILPMEDPTIQHYVSRWLSVQPQEDEDELNDIRESFERRKGEPHIKALITNPMQLSVLLHFIKLKGPAFPNKRAELYREYFKVVIDRDVEKSQDLRKNREIIEALHQLLGYKIHALTEVEKSDGTLNRSQLLEIVSGWLKAQGNGNVSPRDLFKLGEERLGLIVSPKGEGEETRYGYEIQPIREYFAAAFINDQIKGNAHEVFQAMVRRSFWREVALFLAGLRRPNEKADLLVRAKSLDQDNALGWRQDGRFLTFQLLQEGVLSQPQHVFSDAVEYIIDLLDPDKVKVPIEIRELLQLLPVFIKESENESKPHTKRLLEILQKNSPSSEPAPIFRLFRVLSRLLPHDDLKKELMAYSGNNLTLLVSAHLLWPYIFGLDMQKQARSSSYWKGAPESMWAETWWVTGKRYDSATKLPTPSKSYHQRLVENFVLDTSILLVSSDWATSTKIFSDLAAWRLLLYQKILIQTFRIKTTGNAAHLSRLLKSADKRGVKFDGLNNSTQAPVKELLKATRVMIDGLLHKQSIEESLKVYISTINKYLEKPGIASWLACRCASDFLRPASSMLYADSEVVTIQEYLKKSAEGARFTNSFRALYIRQTSSATKLRGSLREDLLQPAHASVRSTRRLSPRFIRVKPKSDLLAISDLLAEHICAKKKLPYSWMKFIALDTTIIPALLKKCQSKMSYLLAGIADLYFYHVEEEYSLSAQTTTKILKIVRNTDDPAILQGALLVLSASSAIKKVDSETILKLLHSSKKGARSGVRIFPSLRSTLGIRKPNQRKLSSSETVARVELARQVISSPSKYNFSVVSAAATFIIENSTIVLPAIQQEEESLGIRIT